MPFYYDYIVEVLNILFIWWAVWKFIKILDRRTDILEYKIKLEANVDENIPELLNSIISECFNEYLLSNFSDEIYIQADEEEKIIRGVGEIVASRMSDVIQIKLNSYYNSDSIEDSISKKIAILVADYVADRNSIKDDKEDLDK